MGETKKPIPKIATGIEGLDEVLIGGIPKGRTTLIQGSTGTGKTVMGLEAAYNIAKEITPVIFLVFEETAEMIRQGALALGLDIKSLEESGRFFLWHAEIDRNAANIGEFGIDSLLAIIKGKAKEMGANFIMLDSIDVLLQVFADRAKEKEQLYRLNDWLQKEEFTTLLTTKADEKGFEQYGFLEYMADCVINLNLQMFNHITTRRIRVIKYRGSGFAPNEYPYIISEDGNIVMPISTAKLGHKPLGKQISSGNKDLDVALGGGFSTVSSVLISGPTGTGKTTLAGLFSRQACSEGRRVLFVSFEQSRQVTIFALKSSSIQLQEWVDKDLLRFDTIMPESVVAEMHLYRILKQLNDFKPDHLIVDGISSTERMGTASSGFDFIVRLTDFCKNREITCLLTTQEQTESLQKSIGGMDISALLDTLLVIKYEQIGGQRVRILEVIKNRGCVNMDNYFHFQITNEGITLSHLLVKS